jgi:hypothetical protein
MRIILNEIKRIEPTKKLNSSHESTLLNKKFVVGWLDKRHVM